MHVYIYIYIYIYMYLSSITTQAHYSAFRLGKKMAAARNGNIYIEFYSSNNNVRRFLQLFSVLMLFIETINYKTGPCVIRRSIDDFEKGKLFL